MSAPARNPLRSRIEGSELLLGGWCTLPTSFAAELVASSGVDYAVIDMQHGLTGYSDLVSMLQAISLAGAVPLVRIPFGDYGVAQRALDAGALGLIFPTKGVLVRGRFRQSTRRQASTAGRRSPWDIGCAQSGVTRCGCMRHIPRRWRRHATRWRSPPGASTRGE